MQFHDIEIRPWVPARLSTQVYSGDNLKRVTGFLEVVGGTAPAGVRLKVEHGGALDVGRSVAADPQMSERHFQCRLNTDGLLIESLGESSSWVNGKRLGRSICRTGDWIFAGTTMFRVMLYSPYSTEALDSPVDTLVRTLVAEADHLHVMFDLADCGGIDGFVPDWRDHSIELAQSPTGGVVYLLSLRAMEQAIKPLVESGLGERYGIWIRQEQTGLGPHLLRYMKGKRWFPYYQPAVLRAFWEGCPEGARRKFLGPVRWMGVVGKAEVLRLASSFRVTGK